MSRPAPTVYKFGGSSVSDAERIRHVAELVARGPERLVVVVSALGGATDDLVAMAAAGEPGAASERLGRLRDRHREVVRGLELDAGEAQELLGRVDARFAEIERVIEGHAGLEGKARTDAVLSAGEDLSATLLAAAVRNAGRAAAWLDARRIVRTDAQHGKAVPDHDAMRALAAEHLHPVLDEGVVAVVQGFVGATADGATTTLGRGGGDYSAALVGGVTGAEVVHIWTDVEGILSGDPRLVAAPEFLHEIGFEEAIELSFFGAKVIHPGAAVEARSHRVPLRIRSTFEPANEGTLIRSDLRGAAEVASIASRSGVALIKVRSQPSTRAYGFLARVFEVLARRRTPVDLVAASHWGTAFTVDQTEELDEAVRELSAFADVELCRDLAAITVVGHGFMQEPGMDALVFWSVGRTPVHLVAQASDVSLSFLVDQDEVPDLVRRLHESLIELPHAAAVVGVEAGDAGEPVR